MADKDQPLPPKDVGQSNLGPTRTTLTAAKETRKRAELDAQLLANRIALLKQEEEKAERKIADTKKRASEILILRKANEDKFQVKEMRYKDKWESIRQNQVQNSYQRDKTKSENDLIRQRMLENKRKLVSCAKAEKSENLWIKKERELNQKALNADRTSHIRDQRNNAKHRQEMERMRKIDAYRQDYEERVAREEELRQRTEVLVTKMEKEEMDLIQRLQNTQALQRSAYEDLEAALNGSQLSRSKVAQHTALDDGGMDSSKAQKGNLVSRPAA